MSNRRNDALSAIIEKAKNDPKFFHDLVFNPEEALKGLENVDRNTKGAIVAANPDSLIQIIVSGTVSWCDVTCTSSCGVTCSGGSCGYTTNFEFKDRYISRFGGKINYCDVTCTSSCGVTCNDSCGHTTNFGDFGQRVRGERVIG
jgi:hypothetical protein